MSSVCYPFVIKLGKTIQALMPPSGCKSYLNSKITTKEDLKIKFKKTFAGLVVFCIAVSFLSVIAPSVLALDTTNPTSLQTLPNIASSTDPGIKVNATSMLQELGYTEQNITSMSQSSIDKILLSQGNQNPNATISQIEQNLFGNSPAPLQVEPQTLTGTACLVVAVWTYLDPSYSSTLNQDAYNALIYNVNNAGYNYLETLTNTQATHTNVWEWLTMLCVSYAEVDVYFIGHGCQVQLSNNPPTYTYGFVCYDAMDQYGNINTSNLYYGAEMQSYNVHPYDYSTLRLGVGGFCWAGTFETYFINQAENQDRAWMGAPGEEGQEYGEYFFAYFGYYWYPEYQTSYTSFTDAANAAAPYTDGYTTIAYTGNGNPFTY